ncbi:YwmB family TATA-box binding protein [Ferroacidibacillus organovorans]|uniref:TATA-box binding protein n=1 Tax=Ferroacidibacillus organovorans TaxID=1765683 RepID=A0A101XPK9_9BACL|nr:YwmB family TATA-box binding protein [Ferroacidibacillus organovorans]KUO95248.1 hypothetical protein ATW55_14015 [Ferroacidibacillus organovorans]
MRKLASVAILLLLGGGLTYQAGQAVAARVDAQPAAFVPETLSATFAHMKATPQRFEVHAWLTLKQVDGTQAALRQEALGIAKNFGSSSAQAGAHTVATKVSVHARQQPNMDVVAVTETLPGMPGSVASVLCATLTYPNAPAQTVAVIRITAPYETSADFLLSYERVVRIAHEVTAHPEVNATLMGSVARELSAKSRMNLLSSAMQHLYVNRPHVTSYTYTSVMSGESALTLPNLAVGKGLQNIQVAAHANSFTHRTEILVGSPMITVEY